MPNYRSLSCMPADGGDLVLAIQRESGRRKFADLWGLDDDLPARDPALVAFETGDHAPRGMTEKPPAEPAASEPVKRGGWVMHDADNSGGLPPVPADQSVWLVARCGRITPAKRDADIVRWYSSRGDRDYDVIAYSTDDECPEWTGV